MFLAIFLLVGEGSFLDKPCPLANILNKPAPDFLNKPCPLSKFLNKPVPDFLNKPIFKANIDIDTNTYLEETIVVSDVKKSGIANLQKDIENLHWVHKYKRNYWDCSNMSLCLAIYLATLGWNVKIAQGRNHAWLIVETSGEDYVAVEATTITILKEFPKYSRLLNIKEAQEEYPNEYFIPYEQPWLFRTRTK